MKIRLFCGIAMLLGLFSAVNLHAQDTGDITGTVRDNTGAVIQGAEVKINGAAGGIQRTTTTNSDGDYLEAGLPGGTYNLTITAKGFKTFKAMASCCASARRLAWTLRWPSEISPPKSSCRARI